MLMPHQKATTADGEICTIPVKSQSMQNFRHCFNPVHPLLLDLEGDRQCFPKAEYYYFQSD